MARRSELLGKSSRVHGDKKSDMGLREGHDISFFFEMQWFNTAGYGENLILQLQSYV